MKYHHNSKCILCFFKNENLRYIRSNVTSKVRSIGTKRALTVPILHQSEIYQQIFNNPYSHFSRCLSRNLLLVPLHLSKTFCSFCKTHQRPKSWREAITTGVNGNSRGRINTQEGRQWWQCLAWVQQGSGRSCRDLGLDERGRRRYEVTRVTTKRSRSVSRDRSGKEVVETSESIRKRSKIINVDESLDIQTE